MKKLLLTFITGAAISASAQNDTLLWADFETDPSLYIQNTAPPGNPTDTSWYNIDGDGYADGSGSGRPAEWFWTMGYSIADSANSVFGSNSWTSPAAMVQNWLITKSVQLIDANAVLSWKSAPYQTPLYLDGYHVLVAEGTNDFSGFTDTIFVAAEYEATLDPNTPNSFSSYQFSSGYVHGMNGTYTEYDTDSSRLSGVLQPHSVSLAQYAGKTIFFAFLHSSTDDNLLAIDDILVTGTDPLSLSAKEIDNSFSVNVFPNPATDKATVTVTLKQQTDLTIEAYDIMGRKVYSAEKKNLSPGAHNIGLEMTDFSNGVYQVKVSGNDITVTTKIEVKK